MQQTRSAQDRGRPKGRPFCFNEFVAKDYCINETDEELRLHVPPPNVAWKVAFATIVASSSVWFAGVCFYFSLARSESNWVMVYCIAYNVLLAVCAAALRILYRQLVAKQIIFGRHVVGVDYRLLGIQVRQRWFRADRVQQWVTTPNGNGKDLLLAMQYQDRIVKLVETLDPDLWLGLTVRMQRKDFVYV